jgi:hypothetical protein
MLGLPSVEEFVHEELAVAYEAGVRGIDTSLPFVLGVFNRLLTVRSKKELLGDITKYERIKRWRWPLIRLNIKILQHWCATGSASQSIPIELIREVASTETDDRRVFALPEFALRYARVPAGYYAIQYEGERPIGVRPLAHPHEKALSDEKLVHIAYG